MGRKIQTIFEIHRLAKRLAREEQKYNFQSRRGYYAISGDELGWCLSSNNPNEYRTEELRRLRSTMAERGIVELAYATYGDDMGDGFGGYTFALIIEVPEPESIERLVDDWREIIGAVLDTPASAA